MASWLGRKTLRLLFYGSDHFSLASLRALLSLKLPLAVVTKRRCPVQQVAKDAGLTIHYWPFTVPKGQFDLGVVVSFGQLIPAACIRACTHGMVNVHPSLLPRWRGAAPLVHTILANDERAGVSLITVAQNRFDTGFIINQTLLKESPRDLEYVDLERISARAGKRKHVSNTYKTVAPYSYLTIEVCKTIFFFCNTFSAYHIFLMVKICLAWKVSLHVVEL